MTHPGRGVEVPLARYETVAWDNPQRPAESYAAYIERLCVLAGGIEPGDGFLSKDHAWPTEAEDVRVAAHQSRLPYADPE